MPYNADATEALFDALNAENPAAALTALDNGADPNATREEMKNSALMFCALYHLSHVTRALLEKGADPDYRRVGGETALMMCGLSNDRTTAKLIVDAGANILLQDDANKDAAAHAIERGNRGLAKLYTQWADERKARIAAEAERKRLEAELRQNIADTVAVAVDGLHTAVKVKAPLRLKDHAHG